MKVLIIGTGAVGGFYGLKLLKNGVDVTFTARNITYRILKEQGIILDSFETGIEKFGKINLLEFSELSRINNKYDLILVCVKSYNTQETAAVIKNLIHQKSCVISMQNGLENEDILSKYIDPENVAGAVVFISSALEKNIVKHTGAGILKIGKISKSPKYDIELIKNIFTESGVACTVSDNIMLDLWIKILWNASFNALSVVLEATVSDMINDDNSRNLLRAVMEEAVKVAHAAGYKIPHSKIDKNLDIENNAGEFKTSMLQDFEKKKKLEFEFINGAIVRFADKYGVSAPINKMLINILSYKERKNMNSN
ncbi:2-dehydropantoate 2-reductase [Candidatus Dependentiae bacterium]|nr:2-dehydropantoate 2-reductase [Candidatus Dependentiae bacterium]